MYDAGFDAVGVTHVPVVVKAPDDHVVFLDEGALLGPDRIVFRHAFRSVEMGVERGLVRDYEIQTASRGAFENVERGHHGDGNSGHRRIWITRLEGVDGVLLPFDADLLLDLFDDGCAPWAWVVGRGSEKAARRCQTSMVALTSVDLNRVLLCVKRVDLHGGDSNHNREDDLLRFREILS